MLGIAVTNNASFGVTGRREYHIVVLGAGGVGKSCLTGMILGRVGFVLASEGRLCSLDQSVAYLWQRNLCKTFGLKAMIRRLKTLIASISRADNVFWKSGTEQFTAMRELYMKQGQGFLLVFSITSMSSLNELSELREQIIRIKDDEKVPIVIVGNKSDLEEDRAVPRARAFALSQSWGNAPYYETSARRRANVNEVFIDLCRQIIRKDLQGSSTSDYDAAARKREGQTRQDRKRERKRQVRRKGPCVIL
ncbi:hypothetical protein AOCH_004550 [Aspergillus ochraceoroseus]|uniref:RAS small monomeric GTPase n=1 Tax=Aspergillus ochraceoroseus TaxID=138278 RepID=A0A0F8X6D2_9EURO|nr:hypothetical protein AOCH_004550 [Aspergillus ochraceoroseus]